MASLSFIYTKPTSLILCRFWTEIERDRKQLLTYSVLSTGHIHTGKERGGGGWGIPASRSISVRIGLKSGRKVFWNIVANGIFRCLVGRGVSQLLLFYLYGSNHFNERGGGGFPPIFNSFFCRTFCQIVFIHRWQFSLNHDGWDKKNLHIQGKGMVGVPNLATFHSTTKAMISKVLGDDH